MCDCIYCKHIREKKTYQQSVEEIKEILGKKKMSYCLDCGIDLTCEEKICSLQYEQILLEEMFDAINETNKIYIDLNEQTLCIARNENLKILIHNETNDRYYQTDLIDLFDKLKLFSL
jgi:hypothetical protein